jgi:hypothetical protein
MDLLQVLQPPDQGAQMLELERGRIWLPGAQQVDMALAILGNELGIDRIGLDPL